MSPAWVFPGRRGSDQKQANIIFEWAACGQSLSCADDWMLPHDKGYVNGEQIVMAAASSSRRERVQTSGRPADRRAMADDEAAKKTAMPYRAREKFVTHIETATPI